MPLTRARIVDVARLGVLAGPPAMTIALAEAAGVSNGNRVERRRNEARGRRRPLRRDAGRRRRSTTDEPVPPSGDGRRPTRASLCGARRAGDVLLSERSAACSLHCWPMPPPTTTSGRCARRSMANTSAATGWSSPGWSSGSVTHGLTAERAVDVLWVLTSPDTVIASYGGEVGRMTSTRHGWVARW